MRRFDVKGISTPPAYTPTFVGLVMVFGVAAELLAILPLPEVDSDLDAQGRTRQSENRSMSLPLHVPVDSQPRVANNSPVPALGWEQ